MAQPDERVIEALATELRRRPALGEAFLRQLAVSIDGGLRSLAERPFRVQYVFPARQRAAEMLHAEAASPRRRARRGAGGDRKRARKRGSAIEVAGQSRNGAARSSSSEHGSRTADSGTQRATESAPVRSMGSRGRSEAPASPAQAPARATEEPRMDRQRVRDALLAFARDIAAAEQPGELVAAIGDVDRHIDRAMMSAAA